MGDANGVTSQGQVFLNVVREGRSFSGRERHCLFLNAGGRHFADVSAVTGFDLPDDGRALAQVDWDNDGDQDFWISNRNGPQIRFLQNQQTTKPERHFVLMRLTGKESNRDAVGARVQVYTTQDARPVTRTLRAGDGFLSQSSKTLHFGLGSATAVERIDIRWPSGKRQQFRDIPVDCLIQVKEGKDNVDTQPVQRRTIRKNHVSPHPDNAENEAADQLVKAICFSMIGFPANDYVDQQGMRRPIMDPDSRMVLVNLWASWCQPCVRELSEITRHADLLKQRRIDVLALSVDEASASSSSGLNPQHVLSKLQYPFRSGVADEELLTKLQMVNDVTFEVRDSLPIPTSFLLDRRRRILAIYKGPVSVQELIADIDRMRVKTTEEWRSVTVPFPGRWMMPPRSRHLFDLVNELADQGFLNEARQYVAENPEMFRRHPMWPALRKKLSSDSIQPVEN